MNWKYKDALLLSIISLLSLAGVVAIPFYGIKIEYGAYYVLPTLLAMATMITIWIISTKHAAIELLYLFSHNGHQTAR